MPFVRIQSVKHLDATREPPTSPPFPGVNFVPFVGNLFYVGSLRQFPRERERKAGKGWYGDGGGFPPRDRPFIMRRQAIRDKKLKFNSTVELKRSVVFLYDETRHDGWGGKNEKLNSYQENGSSVIIFACFVAIYIYDMLNVNMVFKLFISFKLCGCLSEDELLSSTLKQLLIKLLR